MFFDLKTIWSQVPDPAQKIRNVLTDPGPRNNSNKGRGQQWENRRRRIGVLFSKQNIWNFIVLIGPGDSEMGFSIVDIDTESEYPNTHTKGNRLAKCLTRVLRLRDIINLIDVRLKQSGPEWIETLARAIIVGWGEFLREMRSEIIKVNPACLSSLEQIRDNGWTHIDHYNDEHCWHLFEQRLILRETEHLTRAVLSLEKAQEAGITLPWETTNLKPSLDRIEQEVETDQILIKDVIDMVILEQSSLD